MCLHAETCTERSTEADTAHKYGLGLTAKKEVASADRERTIEVGLEKGTLSLSVFSMIPNEVTFENAKGRRKDRVQVTVQQYSESGECIGEGYYQLLLTPQGQALGGHTKYWVNGGLARDCKVTRKEAQGLFDNVVSKVIDSLQTLKVPKRKAGGKRGQVDTAGES